MCNVPKYLSRRVFQSIPDAIYRKSHLCYIRPFRRELTKKTRRLQSQAKRGDTFNSVFNLICSSWSNDITNNIFMLSTVVNFCSFTIAFDGTMPVFCRSVSTHHRKVGIIGCTRIPLSLIPLSSFCNSGKKMTIHNPISCRSVHS